VQLREELDSWNEHGSKHDRERLPSFNEDSFVNSTSQDEVQYLKAIVNKLQQEKQQWSKNVNFYENDNLLFKNMFFHNLRCFLSERVRKSPQGTGQPPR
jgi:hypothetical protein